MADSFHNPQGRIFHPFLFAEVMSVFFGICIVNPFVGIRKLLNFLLRLAQLLSTNGPLDEKSAVRYIGSLVKFFGKGKNSCFYRSLILFYLLRRRGVGIVIHFSANLEGEKVSGHAWLVKDGELYLEDQSSTGRLHDTLFSFPENG